METFEHPFSELPEALVEEILSKSERIGLALSNSFKEIQASKNLIREKLKRQYILKKESDLIVPETPTTCGIDGSYAIEKLLALDFIACAAVAVEGFIPPKEIRFWPKPHHRCFVSVDRHSPDSGIIARGLMMTMEIELAAKAPHDVVFIDGSLTTPLIYLNQAVNKALNNKEREIAKELINRFETFVEYYKTILKSMRNDKIWAGIPKYTSKRELGKMLEWTENYDDRAILTSILEPGEYTKPLLISSSSESWHLKFPSGEESREFDVLLKDIHIIYYKPNRWTPALRVEISPSIAQNEARIAILLHALKYQCRTPGVLEPYPLYMADRMVKHLGKAIPTFRQNATKKVVEEYEGDVGEIFYNLHGYRTEMGR